jgi:hypothetical protein
MTAANYDLYLRDTRADTLVRWDAQAYAASGIVLASRCYLHEIMATSKAAATAYLHMFDSATVPSNGAIPVVMPMPITTDGVIVWSPPSQHCFLTGLVWALSTTRATLTLASADVWVDVTYET